MPRGGKARQADGTAAHEDDSSRKGTPRGKKAQSNAKYRPGKLGFDGVEDDGAAQSKYKGLSSGAKASLRRKAEERISGEAEPIFEPPDVPVHYVDCLFFASDLDSKKDGTLDAARALSSAGRPPSDVFEAFRFLGGSRCDGAVPAYVALAEMDARAGDLRYRAWERHRPRHALYGLDTPGMSVIGAAVRAAQEAGAVAASDGVACDAPLATLIEMWEDPSCVAAGPLHLSSAGVGGSASGRSTTGGSASGRVAADDPAVMDPLRGMARLLREAMTRRLPVVLSCDDDAESDLARLALATLEKALAEPVPEPSTLPAASGRALPPARHVCPPLIVYGAPGLWERLHAGRRGCAYFLFDGTVTFAKAPRTLLSVAFDVPTDRLLLASAACGAQARSCNLDPLSCNLGPIPSSLPPLGHTLNTLCSLPKPRCYSIRS